LADQADGEQIAASGLPTRPTRRTDSRSKGFAGASVEADAIEPRRLRRIAAGCIERHVADHALDVLRAAEEGEREALNVLALGVRSAANGRNDGAAARRRLALTPLIATWTGALRLTASRPRVGARLGPVTGPGATGG